MRARCGRGPILSNWCVDVIGRRCVTTQVIYTAVYTDTAVLQNELRYSLELTVVFCVAYSMVFIVGVTGNCAVVAVVCRSPRMRTPTNLFIANLACADLLVNRKKKEEAVEEEEEAVDEGEGVDEEEW
ncbi:hypothetical protein LSTR_LSTR006013 [Laodelphax striatellus]|uniref:G-protein coupled receptors family 1 profile domain-containing protein n=1 Tax=Laodelphax striatellus TaxID=195883 RepID=A0A482XQM7_LAOST|nr:hypothetical protein LSTR_LSTR006013 [Laodelphax striatellus]